MKSKPCNFVMIGIVVASNIIKPVQAKTYDCQTLWETSRKFFIHQVEIDVEARERWVASNPKELRPLARWIVDNITIIKYAELEEYVATAFKSYLSGATATGRETVFLTNSMRKSGAWITGFVQRRFTEVTNAPVFVIEKGDPSLFQPLKHYLEQHPNTDVIVLDDGIYSGQQIGSFFWSIFNRSDGRGINWPPEKLFAIVGFTHKERLIDPESRGGATKDEKDLARLIAGVRLPSVQEILKRSDQPTRDLILSLIDRATVWQEDRKGEFFGQTLTLTQHRIPDFKSFPEWIVKGRRIDSGLAHREQEDEPKKPFIFFPSGQQPYVTAIEELSGAHIP